MVEILKSEKSMFCDLKSHVELQYIYFILQIPFSKNIYHLIAPNFGLGFAIGKWWYNSNISKNNILSVTFTMIFVYGMYTLGVFILNKFVVMYNISIHDTIF